MKIEFTETGFYSDIPGEEYKNQAFQRYLTDTDGDFYPLGEDGCIRWDDRVRKSHVHKFKATVCIEFCGTEICTASVREIVRLTANNVIAKLTRVKYTEKIEGN